MTARRLLYLDSQRLSAYAWRQGRLQPEGTFENRADDLARFAEYLRLNAASQYQLLANLAEEGHEIETIPFLQGQDRAALIARKLGQHFLGTPFATAIPLGYEKSQRKNEKLLLTALTNPAAVEPWLEALRDAEVALAGLYTVAQLGGRLLAKLGRPTRRALLLTCQDHSVRESLILDGQTVFSRLVSLADSSIAGIAARYSSEAAKLHQYLVGKRLLSRSDTLPVFAVAHPVATGAVRQACVDTPQLAFDIIDSHFAARQIGLKSFPDDSRCELLFLQLLAAAPPRQQLAPAIYRHGHRIGQIRAGLLALGGIGLFASALFAAQLLYDAHELRDEARTLAASEAEMNWRYREITATFPQLSIDNETLRRVTDRQNRLLAEQRLPDAAFRMVSRALGEAPNVQVDAIEWSAGEKVLPAVGQGGAQLPSPAMPGSESIVLRGSIRLGPASTTRQVLATFEHFVDSLRIDRGNEVTVTKQPFEIESGRPLRGSDVEEEGAGQRNFVIQIQRRSAP